MPTAGRSKLDILNDAAGGAYQKIYELHGGKQRKVLIDMTTARAILAIYRALSSANQEKYLRYPLSQMAAIAWKLHKNPIITSPEVAGGLFGHMVSGLKTFVNPSFRYVYRPGVLDRVDPTVIKGRAIPPHTLVRVFAKRPAGGRMIRGWGRTFAWIMDIHGNEQIVFKRALQKTSATGY
jgi:hypothetical protein